MLIPRVGLPESAVGWAALALGGAAIWGGGAALRAARRREGWVVIGLCALAALLSWGYVHAYLRGGPRIIDATSYWLEARALAGGHVTWPAGEPETSTLGRFLVRSEDAGGVRAGVLFPPGYPALLALGFLVGAPLLVGPLLAAALVLATYALGREVARGEPALADAPLLAAALSVVCAALRYHTADTMSHGLAALCFTLAIVCALRARGAAIAGAGGAGLAPSGASVLAPSGAGAGATGLAPSGAGARAAGLAPSGPGAGVSELAPSGGSGVVWAALAGLAGGWLFATRPASGVACAAAVAVLLGARPRLLAAAAAGALPCALLFLLHQHAVTGQWLVTAHAASYATNDGPAGCFRYGFGEGVGCRGEHGDFVRANLPGGFGAWAAIKTTARRLWMHLVDAGNAEPLALLVVAGAVLAWRRRPARILVVSVAAQIAAYVPFYFDGNYPGGGARFFADVLPAEHVLLALAAAALAARLSAGGEDPPGARTAGDGPPGGTASRRPLARLAGSGAFVVGLALAGFGLRAGHDHAQLRDRDGGAPLFSQEALSAPGLSGPGLAASGPGLVASGPGLAASAPGLSGPVLAASGAARALVFVDTDAAYNLAFDPGARAAGGVDVVRWKGDALDALARRSRGSPPAFLARFEVPPGGGPGHTVLTPFAPEDTGVIEGESLWPPIAQVGNAYALPVYAGGACAGGGRVLRLLRGEPSRAGAGERASASASGSAGASARANASAPTPVLAPALDAVEILLPPPLVAGRTVTLVLAADRGPASAGEVAAALTVLADGAEIASAVIAVPPGAPLSCAPALAAAIPGGASRVAVRLSPRWAAGGDPEGQPLVGLDRVVAAPPGPGGGPSIAPTSPESPAKSD